MMKKERKKERKLRTSVLSLNGFWLVTLSCFFFFNRLTPIVPLDSAL
jgi:hypothetical protein